MRFLVVYPGRFHPFHRGHKASYDHLVRQFGEDNVYIVSSNKQAPLTSPFSFADKLQMMTKLGIPSGRIKQVTNPYQARELTKDVQDPENTVLIFAVSKKDMEPASAENPDGPRFNFVKKDGTPGYMQPLPDDMKNLKPMTQNAYVAVTPTVNFQVQGADANSASEIRKKYTRGSQHDREQIIADLYGESDLALQDLFDRKLGTGQEIKNIVKEAREKNPARALKLLETVKRLERQAHHVEQLDEILPAIGAAVGRALVGAEAGALAQGAAGLAGHAVGSEIEDLLDLDEDSDYIDEKWSQKYKRSINCNRPRGFSQKAHCAGRKK